jgi:hypothetical protein
MRTDGSDLGLPQDTGNGYVCFNVTGHAKQALLEDLAGLEWARWLAGAIRNVYEQASFGAKIHGPTGTFDGVVAPEMPGFWKVAEGEDSLGVPIWRPDGRHPLGKWLGDVSGRLFPLPPPEILDAILRKHGIEGSRDFVPVMKSHGDGFAVMVHRPKAAVAKIPGVSRDDSLMSLWQNAMSVQVSEAA